MYPILKHAYLPIMQKAPDFGGSIFDKPSNIDFSKYVGMNAQQARREITSQTPYDVRVVPDGSMVTMDYNPLRVRLFTDKNGNIARHPRAGSRKIKGGSGGGKDWLAEIDNITNERRLTDRQVANRYIYIH